MSLDSNNPAYPFYIDTTGMTENHPELADESLKTNVLPGSIGAEHTYFSANGAASIINSARSTSNSLEQLLPVNGKVPDKVFQDIAAAARQTKTPYDLLLFACDWIKDLTSRSDASDASSIAQKMLTYVPQLRSSFGRDPSLSEIFSALVLNGSNNAVKLYNNAIQNPDAIAQSPGSSKDQILLNKKRGTKTQPRTNLELYDFFSKRVPNGKKLFHQDLGKDVNASSSSSGSSSLLNAIEQIIPSVTSSLTFLPQVNQTIIGPQGPSGVPGEPGQNATIEIGSVVNGSNVSVTNSGTPTNAVLNFVLPSVSFDLQVQTVAANSNSSDITTTISNAITNNVPLYIPSGTYVLDSVIDFSPMIGREVILGGDVIFDFSNATNLSNFPDYGCVLVKGDALTQLPQLTSNVNQYDLSVTFASDPDLNEGDRFCIFNPTEGSFSEFRYYYYAGEWCQVADGSQGATVRLYGSLFDSYDSSIVNLYKHPNKPIAFSGGYLTIKEPVADSMIACSGFIAERIADSDFSHIRPTNSGNAGMSLLQCIGIKGSGYQVRQSRVNSNGTSYGIVIGNCQDCVLSGMFEGGRHAIAHGGSSGIGCVPYRNIHFSGIARNGPDAVIGTGAYNLHGNGEYCSFTGLMDGGATLSGNHASIKGTIRTKASQLACAIEFTELHGTDFDCSGVRVEGLGNPFISPYNVGVVDLGGNNTLTLNSYTKHGGHLNFDNMTFVCPNARMIFLLANRGYSGTESVYITMRGTTWESSDTGDPVFAFIENISGDNFYSIDLSNLNNMVNARYSIPTTVKMRGWKQSGNSVLTPSVSNTSVTQSINFNGQAPKVPNVVGSISTTLGGKNVNLCSSATAFAISLDATTIDGSNFSTTDQAVVSWIATIDDF